MVIALLILLLLALLGLGTGAAEPQATRTYAPAPPVATIDQTMFTVDGTALRLSKALRLREGQILRFPRGTENVRLNRLECAHDAHRIALRGDSWRVPDLPSGEYLLSAVILRHDFGYLVHVRSHAAPCPGP